MGMGYTDTASLKGLSLAQSLMTGASKPVMIAKNYNLQIGYQIFRKSILI